MMLSAPLCRHIAQATTRMWNKCCWRNKKMLLDENICRGKNFFRNYSAARAFDRVVGVFVVRRWMRSGVMSYRVVMSLGLVAFALAGCNTAGPSPDVVHIEAVRAEASVARGSHGPYVLRPTDQVRIQVYNEPSISGDYQIDSGGYVSIPLAGRIKAAGITAGRLEQMIVYRLNQGLLNDPRVNVQVSSYTPFYIHGEVKKSGEFPFRPGLTVMDAVASAGGFTYRADESKAYVRRVGASIETRYSLTSSVPVHPGDNIRIAERFF